MEEMFVHEGVLGTVFTGQLVGTAKVGNFDAVIPKVCGRAYVTSISDVIVEADDPLPLGFIVADIWG